MAETPMVEKVARALAAASRDSDWSAWVPDAKSAIRALREPTEAVVKATSLQDWIGHPEANSGTIERWHAAQRRAAIRNWQAGIDAALAVPDEGSGT